MKEKGLSAIYANALLEISEKNNNTSNVLQELEFVSKLFTEDIEFRHFFNAPVILKIKKKQFIDKIFGGNFSNDFITFIKVLIDNNRQFLLPSIYTAFLDQNDKLNNRQKVKVITSVEVGPDVLTKISEIFSKKFNTTAIIEHEVDSSIIGGIIIKMEDMIIDGSIIKDMKNIKSELLAEKIDIGLVS